MAATDPASSKVSFAELPETFIDRADQLLGARLRAEIPIPAKSADGLFEACQSVARDLGVELSPSDSDPDENLTRDAALDRILRSGGLRHRQINPDSQWFTGDSGPFLGFLVEDGRPVALIPHRPGDYRLVDPVRRTSTRVTPAIAATLQSRAVMLYRPFPDGPLNAATVLKFALRGHAGDLWLIFIVGILAALLGLLTPLATEVIINDIIPGAERGQLLQIGLGLLVVALAMMLFHAAAAYAMLRIEGRGDHDVQSAIWNRVLQLNTDFFTKFSAGDLANRIDGINSIRHALSTAVVGYMLGAIFSILNLALIFYYSWKLAIVAIVLVFVAGVVDFFTAWFVLKFRRRSLNLAGRITGRVYQLLTGIVKWRTAAAESRALDRWSPLFIEKKRLDKISGYFSAAASSFRAFFPIATTLVNFAFFFFFLHGELNTGAFLAYNAAFGQMLSAVLGATSASITLINCIPFYERVRPILTAPTERESTGADPGRLTGAIEFRNLRFRYAPDLPAVLDGVSFKIDPGEFAAIVGTTGCGKSTLVRLLLGFEDPLAGDIFYDGRDFRNLDLHAVRRQLGVVLQHDRVRTGDILHNIIGAGAFTINDAWDAADRAGIKDDIARMPMGMHTYIPDGGNGFSGGQLQRIVIARALIKNPSLLVFDEATSALDNTSQKIVSDNLRSLAVTRIVIAQRLSSIRHADKIIVLDQGRVAQVGPFEELIASEGVFQRLAARQLV